MHARATVVPLLAAAALLVGACGGDDDGTGAADAAADGSDAPSDDTASSSDDSTEGDATPAEGADDGCTEERAGGTATIGVFSESVGLDAIGMFGGGVAGGIETAAIYDRLMVWDPETGEYEPHVAESLEPNDDFTVWTLTLREGINFGNGDPLTADAVVHSIERTQSDENQSPSRISQQLISSVEATDVLTVEFTLSEGWANFPALLADEAGMITNPSVVESMDPEEFNTAPVGAGVGPYEPVTFAPGEEIVLEAKADYWGGPVCIEELRFVTITGGQATWDAFQNDELDLAVVREPRIVDDARTEGVGMIEYVQNLGEMVVFNNDDGHPTGDVRVRQAIAHAIDPAAIDERVNEGTGMPASAVIGEASLHHSGAAGPEHDPEEAERLLDEAKADGYDGSLTFICNTPRSESALAIEAQLEAVGFDVDLNSNLSTSDLIQQVLVERAFDVTCYGWNVNDTSPWLRLTPKIGPSNTAEASYESDDMTAALDELRLAADPAEQQSALESVQEVWNADVPGHGLATVSETILWDDDVHGLSFTAKTVVLFDDAYLE